MLRKLIGLLMAPPFAGLAADGNPSKGKKALRPLENAKRLEMPVHEFSGQNWSQRTPLIPAFHIEEVPITPGEAIPGKPKEIDKRWYGFSADRWRYRSLHRAPAGKLPEGFITRDQPGRPASVTFADQAKDWEFMLEYRARVFQERGIKESDSDWDKVWALGEDIWQHHRDGRSVPVVVGGRKMPSSHPVDTLKESSWCVGACNALVMVCASMRIPARACHERTHSMAEVWIDGAWRFAENAPSFLRGGKGCLSKNNWAQILADPARKPGEFTPTAVENYWTFTDGVYLFGQTDGLFMWEDSYRYEWLTPQTAASLYPEWSEPVYKSDRPDRYMLVFGIPNNPLEIKVAQGQALMRDFWLGSLANTKELLASINGTMLSEAVSSAPLPLEAAENGGDWFIAVNEQMFPLRDQGGWKLKLGTHGKRKFRTTEFSIPLNALRENSWNQIGIGNAGKGQECISFGANPEVLASALSKAKLATI